MGLLNDICSTICSQQPKAWNRALLVTVIERASYRRYWRQNYTVRLMVNQSQDLIKLWSTGWQGNKPIVCTLTLSVLKFTKQKCYVYTVRALTF